MSQSSIAIESAVYWLKDRLKSMHRALQSSLLACSTLVDLRAIYSHALAMMLLQPLPRPFLTCRPFSRSALHEYWQAIFCCAIAIHNSLEPAAGLFLLVQVAPLHCTDSASYPGSSAEPCRQWFALKRLCMLELASITSKTHVHSFAFWAASKQHGNSQIHRDWGRDLRVGIGLPTSWTSKILEPGAACGCQILHAGSHCQVKQTRRRRRRRRRRRHARGISHLSPVSAVIPNETVHAPVEER